MNPIDVIRGSRNLRWIKDKKGNEFVEAGIVLPLIMIVIAILLRMFTFYFDILTTATASHERALMPLSCDGEGARVLTVHTTHESVSMAPSLHLHAIPHKDICVTVIDVNEDLIVRTGEMIDE